jgi:hypothetical protein
MLMKPPAHTLPWWLLLASGLPTLLAGLLWAGVASGALKHAAPLGESQDITSVSLWVLETVFWSGMAASLLFILWIMVEAVRRRETPR